MGELAPHPITGGARSRRATGKDGIQEASSADGAGGLGGLEGGGACPRFHS